MTRGLVRRPADGSYSCGTVVLRLYVMPISGTGSRLEPRRPKYRDAIFPTTDLRSGMFDYGNEPYCLVGLVDPPPAIDDALDALPDVLQLPANLDQPIGSGAALTRARTGLESVNIPGTWIQPTHTWREIVRFTGAVCQFAQRYQGIDGTGTNRWFSGGVTLASTFGSLPAGVRSDLAAAAASFAFDTSAITAATTLRQILLSVGQQYLVTQPSLILAGEGL